MLVYSGFCTACLDCFLQASRDPVMKKISQLNLEVEGDDIASEKCVEILVIKYNDVTLF